MAAPEAVVARLEAVAARLERVAAKMGGGAVAEDEDATPQYVMDWDSLMNNELKAVKDAFTAMEYAAPNEMLDLAFGNVRDYMALTPKCSKPTPEELQQFLAPCIAQMGAADDLVRTRDRKLFKNYDNHHKALLEVINSLVWVSQTPPNGLPMATTKGAIDSAQFHLTRILMKQKTDQNKAWVTAVKALLEKQAEIVKEWFKTGLEWKAGGTSVLETEASAPAAAPAEETPATETGSPATEEAAPCTEETPAKKPVAKKKAAAGPAGASLIAQLQTGGAITSGLKKVKKSQKTKYRKNRAGKVTIAAKKAKAKKKLPDPSKQKRGFTWMIQYYQEGLVQFEEDEFTIKEGLFFTQCLNTQFMVKGKVKSIVLDSLQRCQIQVHDVVSTIEMVNCKNVTIYCAGQTPSVALDKSESPRVVCLPGCWHHENGRPAITYSNVTAANLSIPGETEEDDFIELPLYEQFVAEVDENNRLVCKPMKHEG